MCVVSRVPGASLSSSPNTGSENRDCLAIVMLIDDPVFLPEPLVRSTNWSLDAGQQISVFGCEYMAEALRTEGTAPHHLPGSNFESERGASRWDPTPCSAE